MHIKGTYLGVVAVVVSLSLGIVACGGSSGSSSGSVAAPAASVKPAAVPTTVTIAMHDPGCHWFQVGGSNFTKTLKVSGPVSLANNDIAPLSVSGAGTVPVGGKLPLKAGNYTITMVGQSPDDNTLHLVVS